MLNEEHRLAVPPRERSFAALLGDLKDDTIKLAAQHAKLIKVNFSQWTSEKTRIYGLMAGGCAIGLSGFVVFLSGLASLLSMAFGEASGPRAGGQLIVGALVAIAGGIFSYIISRQLVSDMSSDQMAASVAEENAENLS